MKNTLRALNPREWRAWLRKNHDAEEEVWLIFSKKGSGLKSITYDDALDEALCFGWIDSLVRRIDDRRYGQKFTPRRDGSKWSLSNRQRVARLTREGRMARAGLAKLPSTLQRSPDEATGRPDTQPEAPPIFLRALKKHPRARKNYESLAPSSRKLYVRWILAAKRDETRSRRVSEAVWRLTRNLQLGLK